MPELHIDQLFWIEVNARKEEEEVQWTFELSEDVNGRAISEAMRVAEL